MVQPVKDAACAGQEPAGSCCSSWLQRGGLCLVACLWWQCACTSHLQRVLCRALPSSLPPCLLEKECHAVTLREPLWQPAKGSATLPTPFCKSQIGRR